MIGDDDAVLLIEVLCLVFRSQSVDYTVSGYFVDLFGLPSLDMSDRIWVVKSIGDERYRGAVGNGTCVSFPIKVELFSRVARRVLGIGQKRYSDQRGVKNLYQVELD